MERDYTNRIYDLLKAPPIEEFQVHSRYAFTDLEHLRETSIDFNRMLREECAKKLMDTLIEKDMIEFKVENSSNPYNVAVTVTAKIKVQSPHLIFKLSGMI